MPLMRGGPRHVGAVIALLSALTASVVPDGEGGEGA
jgi:hypothetical protein